jgi:prepilin-type N-terminal cleavage/methylation domain-containing protein
MKKSIAGFTLTELLVVVSVISILASVLYANFNDGSKQSRDAERKADLVLVQAALELYKQENGRYPAGCNGASGDGWSGEQGPSSSPYDDRCSGGDTQYIVGLAPKYIKVLPKDPKPGSGDYGYVYRTNAQGTVYKFVARKSVESEFLVDIVSNFNFKACDIVGDRDAAISQTPAGVNECTTWSEYIDNQVPMQGGRCALGICNQYYNGGGYNRPALDCELVNIGTPVGGSNKTSYAVWGGYANPADVAGAISDEEKVERGTEQIICDMP